MGCRDQRRERRHQSNQAEDKAPDTKDLAVRTVQLHRAPPSPYRRDLAESSSSLPPAGRLPEERPSQQSIPSCTPVLGHAPRTLAPMRESPLELMPWCRGRETDGDARKYLQGRTNARMRSSAAPACRTVPKALPPQLVAPARVLDRGFGVHVHEQERAVVEEPIERLGMDGAGRDVVGGLHDSSGSRGRALDHG